MHSSNLPEKQRVFGLDILRAAAILFVMIGHSRFYLPPGLVSLNSYFTIDGVSIFFVLSGFLIGGILLKSLDTQKPGFKTLLNFWIRRWVRTLPNYYLVLILLIFLFIKEFDVKIIAPYFIFLQNFTTDHTTFFKESWSLSIEEWFYLIIPAIIFLLAGVLRWPARKAVLFTAVAVLLAVTCLRGYLYLHAATHTYADWESSFKMAVITRLDSLMFGLIGAFFAFYYRTAFTRYKNTLLVAGILILALNHTLLVSGVFGTGFYLHVFLFSVDAAAVLIMLPALGEIRTGSGFLYKCLTHISLVSYSVYLLNFSFVHLWLMKVLPVAGIPGPAGFVIRYLLFWGITLAAATLLYYYFERPILKLREKIKVSGIYLRT